jgi:lipid A 3-O-deacylase
MTNRSPLLIVASVAMFLATTSMAAQARLPTTWAIRADNDYFNFWQSVRDRPDEEYTQGADLSVTWSGRPIVRGWLFRESRPCVIGRPADESCTRLRIAIGQEIYTPSIDSPQLLPGERPYAGWLYTRFSESTESRKGLDELAATIGVTGPPSLAEAAQDVWHRWFNFRMPLGWAGQIPFEPDFAISWTRAREVMSPASVVAGVLHVAPYGRATIGTLATDLTVGGSITLGVNPRPAWQPTGHPSPGHHVGLYIAADAQSKFVVRNLFLDGATFRSSSSVSKEPFVGQVSGAIGLSVGRVRAEWTVLHLTREYTTQPIGHTYSQLAFRVE